MAYFLKLNAISVLYALMIFVPIELMLNVHRMNRLIDWKIGTVNTTIVVTVIIGFIAGTILLIVLTKRWGERRKANYWSAIFWAPYFMLFVYVFASLFPITYRGDIPSPGTGLLAIGVLMFYPFYIVFINYVGMAVDD